MEDTSTSTGTSGTAPAATSAPVSTVNDASASLAAADSSLAAPENRPESTPAAAVAQPAETPITASDPTDDPRSPFIPRARFDEVNTQKKAAEDALKQYEPFKGVAAERMKVAVDLADSFDANPVATLLELQQRVENHPVYGPQLRSQAARTLAGGRQQAQPQADPMPEADLQAGDGTLVYSAQQMQHLRDWDQRRMTSQFQEEIRPLKEFASKGEQREALAAYENTTRQALGRLSSEHPEASKHLRDMHEVIFADERLAGMALNPQTADFALRFAWAEVYRTKVVPQQLRQSEGQTLAHLQQRAVAAAGANPAAAAPITPKSTIGDARAALMAVGSGS